MKLQTSNSVFGIQCSVFSVQKRSQLTRSAFTLIELLVVIAIMAILAALIIPGAAMAKAARMRSRAKAELNQFAGMIEGYKAKMNFYPPSANNSVPTNLPYPPLYYELVGTRQTNAAGPRTFTTLDNNTAISDANLLTLFGVTGLANVTHGAGTPDEGLYAQNFTKGTLRKGQYLEVTDPNKGLKFTTLGTSIEGPIMLLGANGEKINPIGYNSANPTNNPKSYDLWVDIQVRGKTERIYSSFTTL